MKVIVLCGIPGSGKTTWRQRFYALAMAVSADDHFMVDGEYRFDAAQLPQAHGGCQRRFVELVRVAPPWECPSEYGTPGADQVVVVDNTNLSVAEVAPYAALAQAYGHELEIVTLVCDPAVAAARNIHGVPSEAVQRMAAALAERQLPPWWPQRVVEAGW